MLLLMFLTQQLSHGKLMLRGTLAARLVGLCVVGGRLTVIGRLFVNRNGIWIAGVVAGSRRMAGR